MKCLLKCYSASILGFILYLYFPLITANPHYLHIIIPMGHRPILLGLRVLTTLMSLQGMANGMAKENGCGNLILRL